MRSLSVPELPAASAEEVSVLPGSVDGFLHRSAGTSAAPTVVADWEIHGGAISDRIDGVRNTSPSPIAEELQGHEFRVPGYAGHLEAVVGCGRNGARNMGAVRLPSIGLLSLLQKSHP